ncbi:DUF2726 domain-containing protein [Deinococcus humi]|uniref:DUF2726 domain-containing protein n=1 Tax=Deinococcus humi TaxID=662880 RepID=A0A7W8NH92_9DEIO|nr:hypothetical protein [Deinococcus humi]
MTLKRFFNRSEEATNSELYALAQKLGLRLQPKAKLSDVFKIDNSGISDEEFRYALMAHFDFLVMDEDWMPLFVVEFDGPTHQSSEQIERDKKKDKLCKQFGLSILRIDSKFIRTEVRQMSLLAWLCKIWLFERDFSQAQEQGAIPSDEPFLWFSVMSEEAGQPVTYPYDISLPSRLYLIELFKASKTRSSAPLITTYETADVVYAECFFRLTDDLVAMSQSSVKQFKFRGIAPCEVAEELAVIQIAENIKEIFQGRAEAMPMSHARARLSAIEDKPEFRKNGEIWS